MDLNKDVCEEKTNEEQQQLLVMATAKIYNLEKKLKNLKFEIVTNQTKCREKENVLTTLNLEVSALRQHEEILKNNNKKIIETIVLTQNKLDTTQRSFWSKINDFVDNANVFLNTQEKNKNNVQKLPEIPQKDDRTHWKATLVMQSQIEALQLFGKYQEKLIEELSCIKVLLDGDSLP